jgi:SAM-dependent methyltransferase
VDLSLMGDGKSAHANAPMDARNHIGWVLDLFDEVINAPILEIGAGHGDYAEALGLRGEYIGVDSDQDRVDIARRRFPELSFGVADIEHPSFVDAVGANRFGCIMCLNVLEHIDDHAGAVGHLSQVLKPGGHLAIIVPARNIPWNDPGRRAGHSRRYRRQEVIDLLRHSGLEAVRSDYFNPIGGLGWRTDRDGAANGRIRLFDRWAMQASRLLDPLTRRVFGQSVIAVGRKP